MSESFGSVCNKSAGGWVENPCCSTKTPAPAGNFRKTRLNFRSAQYGNPGSEAETRAFAIGRRHASQHPARQKGRGRGGGRGDEQHLRRPPSPVLSEGRGAQSMGSLYRADDLVGPFPRAIRHPVLDRKSVV